MRPFLWLLPVFPVLHHLSHGVVGQVLVEPFVVDLDHGGVGASSEALDLLESEEAISAGLTVLDIVEVLDSLDDVLSLRSMQKQGVMTVN